jgi:hypothetical protein
MNHEPSANNTPAVEKPARRVPPKLSDEQREYIVRRLAAYDSPTAIRRDVRERFGIAVSCPSIMQYDPTRDPRCAKRWADLFRTVRKDRIGSDPDQLIRARQVERLALRIVELLAGRILAGPDASARAFAKDAGAITDEDRLRALAVFVAKLEITDPAGVAEIRRLLFDEPGPHGAETLGSAPGTRQPPGGAPHAG